MFDLLNLAYCSIGKWREDDLDTDLEDVITDDESDDSARVKHSPKRYHNKDDRI